MPSPSSRCHCSPNPILPWCQQQHPNLRHLEIQPHHHITSKQITNALQDTVLAIEEDSFRIATHKIGTYSIRSGAAMAMFLGGCPVFLIMMIGCWSSDTFLRYIWKQVEEFNHNVSQKLLTHMFHRHIPNYTSLTVSHIDPRQHNHPNNAATRISIGGDMA